ncbi:MAG: hypothetical protein U0T36_03955 [Saprospiraceae bacterium]|jgi:dsDNA-specific endonuclease/ATPase MutS2
MNLKDLWIGDLLMIISSGKQGYFKGINKEGKARIAVGNKILLTPSTNLQLIPEKEYYPDIHEYLRHEALIEKSAAKPIVIKFDHTLDLHIEKLAPHLQNEAAGRILEYQLQKSDSFIRHAIEQKYPHFTIIHGKGQGVLKQAIEHQLSLFYQVKLTFSKNGGGAIEVWI